MNDPELMRLLNRSRVISNEEHRRWFIELNGNPNVAYFAIEHCATHAHVGNVWLWGIDRRHQKAEVRIVIGESRHRGKNVGSQAIALVAEYAFQELHLHKVYAYVLCSNRRAARAFERVGFHLEGTLREDRLSEGTFLDVCMFGLLSADDAHH
jgi:RimJ/RimL family protein N-acetyltransferase